MHWYHNLFNLFLLSPLCRSAFWGFFRYPVFEIPVIKFPQAPYTSECILTFLLLSACLPTLGVLPFPCFQCKCILEWQYINHSSCLGVNLLQIFVWTRENVPWFLLWEMLSWKKVWTPLFEDEDDHIQKILIIKMNFVKHKVFLKWMLMQKLLWYCKSTHVVLAVIFASPMERPR